MAISEISNTPSQAAVAGVNNTTGDGVWGQCDAGRGVVGVSKTGSGMWGHTVNGRGVVGVNNEEGSGVWGETKKGRGVVGIVQTDGDGTWGECDAGRGVVGVSKTGSGVWGHTANGRGVVGINDEEGTGVWGETKKGRGVVGVSEQGIGLFGKGGGAAGIFEGRVEVTGSLVVQGVDVIALIQQLQQRIAELEGLVVSPQVITAQPLAPAQGGAASFVITGAGFQPSATINIYVLSTTSAGANRVVFADGQGKFNVTLELPCFPGTVLSIKAVNQAQNQTSNTVTVTCT